MKNEILKNAGLLNEEKKPFPKPKPTKKDMTPYENLGEKSLRELRSIAKIYGDYNDILTDEIIKRDTKGYDIFMFGKEMSEINASKLLRAYGKLNTTSEDIMNAQRDWSSFDYDLGSDLITEKDDDGVHIFLAGLKWKKFNHKKGISALALLGSRWYKKAKKEWPKSATEKLKSLPKETKIPAKRKKL